MQQSLETLFQLDKYAEIRDLGNRSIHEHLDPIFLRYLLVPGIFLELLEPKGNPLSILVHIENDRADRITFLDDLVRMDHLLRPAHVSDMEKSVNSILELYKGSVVGEIANDTLDDRSDREFSRHEIPGVLPGLLHTEGDFLFLLLDLQYHHIGFISDRDHLVGVVDALGPGHLRNMYETFHSRLELDKGAVGEHVDDPALHTASDGILLLYIRPGTLLQLLEPQRDALFLLVDLQNLDLDLLVDLDEIARVADTPPAHIGNVKQPVKSSEIHEGPELGDVLYHSLANLPDLDAIEQLHLLGFTLLFDEPSAGNDYVHARLIDLDDLARHLLPDVLGNISRPANTDLGSGQKDRDADLDEQPALDLTDHLAGDLIPLLVRGDDTFPATLAIGLALGERHQSILILYRLEKDLDLVSHTELRGVIELLERNSPLGFVAHIDDRRVANDIDDLALDYLVLLKAADRLLVGLLNLFIAEALHGLQYLGL